MARKTYRIWDRRQKQISGNPQHPGNGAAGGGFLLTGLSPTGAWSMNRRLVNSYAGSLYTTATGVNSWKDQSGNSRDLDQGTGANQPGTATVGGRTYADFDGANDRLLTVAALSSFIANNAGYMLWVFTVDADVPADDKLIAGDSGAFMGLYLDDTPDEVRSYNWDGNGDKTTSNSYPVTTDGATVYVAEWRHTGGQLGIRVNGGAWVEVASGNTSTMTGVFNVGGKATVGWANIKISEGFILSTVPSTGKQDSLSSNCRTYYGAA